jgi:hypothetical protein
VPSSVQSSLSAASLSTNPWILFMLVLVSGSYSGNGIHTDHDCAGGVVFRAVHAAAAVDCPKSRPSRLPRLCVAATGLDEKHDALDDCGASTYFKCETCPMKDIHWET